jgi:hypothetical protein
MLQNCKQILVFFAVLLVLGFTASQPLHATEHAQHHSDCAFCIQSIHLSFLDHSLAVPAQSFQLHEAFYCYALTGYRADALVFGRLSRAPPGGQLLSIAR